MPAHFRSGFVCAFCAICSFILVAHVFLSRKFKFSRECCFRPKFSIKQYNRNSLEIISNPPLKVNPGPAACFEQLWEGCHGMTYFGVLFFGTGLMSGCVCIVASISFFVSSWFGERHVCNGQRPPACNRSVSFHADPSQWVALTFAESTIEPLAQSTTRRRRGV